MTATREQSDSEIWGRNVLATRGSSVNVHGPVPTHLHKCFGDLGYKSCELPIAEKAANETFWLPMFSELTEQQIVERAAALSGVAI